MKCDNVLCRSKISYSQSGCSKFLPEDVEDCLQHNLYNALQVVVAQNGDTSLDDFIHKAANEVQKTYNN